MEVETITCSECASSYSRASPKCPRCRKEWWTGVFSLICLAIIIAVGVKKCQAWFAGDDSKQTSTATRSVPPEELERNSEQATVLLLHRINKMPSSTAKAVHGADCLIWMEKAENKVVTWADARRGCLDALVEIKMAGAQD
jgi:hypothetical protein